MSEIFRTFATQIAKQQQNTDKYGNIFDDNQWAFSTWSSLVGLSWSVEGWSSEITDYSPAQEQLRAFDGRHQTWSHWEVRFSRWDVQIIRNLAPCIAFKWRRRSVKIQSAVRNAATICRCWAKPFIFWKTTDVYLPRIDHTSYPGNTEALGRRILKAIGCCCGNRMTMSWFCYLPVQAHTQTSSKFLTIFFLFCRTWEKSRVLLFYLHHFNKRRDAVRFSLWQNGTSRKWMHKGEKWRL